MIAYHGKAEIKEKYLARVQAHAKADEIAQGFYWENGKGCAIGCTIHGSDHGAYETELGIPRLIARLEDGIFEGLPPKEAKLWPAQFLDAIKPGADLSKVLPKFMHWLLVDPECGVIRHANTERTRKSIQDVADLYERAIKGDDITAAAWRSADADAAAAAAAAADAWRSAAAWRSADAWRSAKHDARRRQAKKLLELLADS